MKKTSFLAPKFYNKYKISCTVELSIKKFDNLWSGCLNVVV